jgi:hypothetical protein
MRKKVLIAAIGLAAGTMAIAPRDAQACGGCFHPPEENPTVVTDHRMLLSVSKDQTTLYDQIKYSGAPTSFAWVLPISGTVDVGLSAEAAFTALDQITQTRILSPPQNCPSPPSDCAGKNAAFGGGSSGTGGAAPPESADGGVDVLEEKTVGPYETVQLQSSDPAALANWLSSHGYNVTPDVQPIVDAYVAEKFNFLALKLVPSAGLQDMRPVRVTTKGASAALPLRMVSAGTGATVGITLWVISEGRYEPQNFPSFYIDTSDIVWDWTQQRSNYTDLRAQKEQAGGGKIWEIESSTIVLPQTLKSSLYYGAYQPEKDATGTVTKTAQQVADDDFATMFAGIASAQTRITRIRGDISHAALNADLVMTASSDQKELSNTRQLTKELNQPMCPVYQGCEQIGTAPRDEAIARSNGSSNESFGCATTKKNSTDTTWVALGASFLALVIAKAMRSRKK